jgi:hypothetical protein
MGEIYEVRFDMASCGMIYIPTFMMIGCDIEAILSLVPQQFERLQCWYY